MRLKGHRKTKTVFVIFLFAIVSTAVFWVRWSASTQNGGALGFWLTQLDSGSFDEGLLTMQSWKVERSPRQEVAAAAIRKMGTNVLPYLVHAMTNEDSSIKLKLFNLLERVIPWNVSIPRAGDRRRQAALALGVLESAAKPAIPELVKALFNAETCYEANTALVAIGPEGWTAIHEAITGTNPPRSRFPYFSWENYDAARLRPAESLLTEALTNRTMGPGQVCVWALRDIGENKERVMPLLTNALQSGDFGVRWGAMIALGRLGTNALSAVPLLERSLGDPDLAVRRHASQALNQIDPEVVKNKNLELNEN